MKAPYLLILLAALAQSVPTPARSQEPAAGPSSPVACLQPARTLTGPTAMPDDAVIPPRAPAMPAVPRGAPPIAPEAAVVPSASENTPLAIQYALRPLVIAAAFRQRDNQMEVEGVVLQADEFVTDAETGEITLTGNASVRSGSDELRARRIVVNPNTNILTADGDVILTFTGQEIHATRIQYNYETAQGTMENVLLRTRDLIIRAKTLEMLDRERLVARGVRYTTCEKQTRHYELHARRLEIHLGKEAVARNVGIDFFGVRLATVPELRRSLGGGRDSNNTLSPHLGYNNHDGFYAEKELSLVRGEPLWVNLDARLRTFVEPSAGLLMATKGRLHFAGSIYFRDRAGSQRSRHLEVDRFPEIGMVYTPSSRVRPGRFLPSQVAAISMPDTPRYPQRWRFSAATTVGFFRQHAGSSARKIGQNREGGRANIQAQLSRSRLGQKPFHLRDLRLHVRQSFYTGGRRYTVLGLGWGKSWKLGDVHVGVERFDNIISGRSYFLFDQVELAHEWRPFFRLKSGDWDFTYQARINAERGGLFDQVFSLGKRTHCLIPRLTYRTRRQEIGFELDLLGLSRQGRPRTDVSRAGETNEDDDRD